MPNYERLRAEFTSRRISLDYDTGARITGYVAAAKPSTGPVTLLNLTKAKIYDGTGRLVEEHEALSVVPNALVGFRVTDGPGAREWAVLQGKHGPYVVRVNFILGRPAAPTTALTSQLYQWQDGKLAVVEEFPTFGGTDVAVYADDRGPLVAVSNSLSADVRFQTDTVIYRFTEQD